MRAMINTINSSDAMVIPQPVQRGFPASLKAAFKLSMFLQGVDVKAELDDLRLSALEVLSGVLR